MADFDPQTLAWLKSLKLGKTFRTYADFQNGYNFGSIFDKLNLSKGKKFKNSPDMACIFQNYKNVKDLLMENFKVDFPINNIIYKTQQLLKTIRDQCIKYTQMKKQGTLKGSTIQQPNLLSSIQPHQKKMFSNRQKQITMNSKWMMSQTQKQMPQKIQQIQKKLQKFRQQKTKAQLLALQQRKIQIEQARRLIQDHRQYQINKVRNNHVFVKNLQEKVNDVWAKTQHIKRLRVQKDQQFNKFMNDKKINFVNSLRNDEQKNLNDGLQAFQLNCMRQGVQLEHDPDKPFKLDSAQFNRVVVMQRIKNNIKKQQNDKKQRIKRQNRKKVDADQTKLKSDAIWSENNLIDKYSKDMASHFIQCQKIYKIKLQKQAQSQTIKHKFSVKTYIDLPKFGGQQQRQQQFRKNKIMYLKRDIQFLQKKYQSRKSIAEQIIQAFIHVAIVSQQPFEQKEGFSYNQWRQIQKLFMEFTPKKSAIVSSNQDYYADLSTQQKQYLNYIKRQNQWSLYNNREQTEKKFLNYELAQLVNQVIEFSYPPIKVPQNKDIHISGLPLKIAFIGNKLTGKTTHTSKFAQKYGLNVIDPISILKEALDLAKPPPPQDSKKGAKKDAKKPEQQSPQKIQLKQFGTNLLQKVDSVQSATPQILIQVIKFRLKQLYKQKKQQDLVQQFQQAKQKQKARHAQALKDFQEVAKKPKKDSKKGGQSIPQDPPIQNKYFYSKGFIIDSYPFNDLKNLKLLQRQLNNYIDENERLNLNGQQIKNKLSLLLPIPKKQVDPNLHNGTFDLVFQLKAKMTSLQRRNQSRKIDPQTQIIYHPQFNPVPTDVKGLAERLVDIPAVQISKELNMSPHKEFYCHFGDNRSKTYAYQQLNESITYKQKSEQNKDQYQQIIKQKDLTIIQTFYEINSFVQKRLSSKYQDLQQLKIKLDQAKKRKQEEIKQSNNVKQKSLLLQKSQQNKLENQNQQLNQHTGKIENNQSQSQLLQQQSKKEVCENIIQQQVEKTQSLSQILASLSKKDSQAVLSKYLQANDKYQKKMKQAFHQLADVRASFGKSLLNIQKNFVSIIIRPDDKAGKILGFQQNYNKLLSQKLNIVRDSQTTKHLVDKLDQMYDSLWNSLQSKKNEAVNERFKFINSAWLNEEIAKINQIAQKMMQIQLNFVVDQIYFIFAINCIRQGISIDFMPQYLSLGIAPNLQPIYSIDNQDLTKNNRLQYMIKQMKQCLSTIPKWIEKKQKKLKAKKSQTLWNIVQTTIYKQQLRVLQRVQNIQRRVNQRALQQKSYYQALVNKMDDWIIFGIKSENDFVYEIYKALKKSMQEAKRSSVKDIHVKPITQTYKPINQLSLYPIQIQMQSCVRKIPIYSFKIFLQEIKCLCNKQGKIELKAFSTYFQKRKKSKLLDQYLLRLDLDTLQQFLAIQGYLNYRQLALAMLLADHPVCDQSLISDYKRNMEQRYSGLSKVTIEEFPLAGISIKNEEQYNILRQLIFEIFRQSYDERIDLNTYIDTLNVFNQLQVQKYGDSIMMLMEDHMIHHHHQ